MVRSRYALLVLYCAIGYAADPKPEWRVINSTPEEVVEQTLLKILSDHLRAKPISPVETLPTASLLSETGSHLKDSKTLFQTSSGSLRKAFAEQIDLSADVVGQGLPPKLSPKLAEQIAQLKDKSRGGKYILSKLTPDEEAFVRYISSDEPQELKMGSIKLIGAGKNYAVLGLTTAQKKILREIYSGERLHTPGIEPKTEPTPESFLKPRNLFGANLTKFPTSDRPFQALDKEASREILRAWADKLRHSSPKTKNAGSLQGVEANSDITEVVSAFEKGQRLLYLENPELRAGYAAQLDQNRAFGISDKTPPAPAFLDAVEKVSGRSWLSGDTELFKSFVDPSRGNGPATRKLLGLSDKQQKAVEELAREKVAYITSHERAPAAAQKGGDHGPVNSRSVVESTSPANLSSDDLWRANYEHTLKITNPGGKLDLDLGKAKIQLLHTLFKDAAEREGESLLRTKIDFEGFTPAQREVLRRWLLGVLASRDLASLGKLPEDISKYLTNRSSHLLRGPHMGQEKAMETLANAIRWLDRPATVGLSPATKNYAKDLSEEIAAYEELNPKELREKHAQIDLLAEFTGKHGGGDHSGISSAARRMLVKSPYGLDRLIPLALSAHTPEEISQAWSLIQNPDGDAILEAFKTKVKEEGPRWLGNAVASFELQNELLPLQNILPHPVKEWNGLRREEAEEVQKWLKRKLFGPTGKDHSLFVKDLNLARSLIKALRWFDEKLETNSVADYRSEALDKLKVLQTGNPGAQILKDHFKFYKAQLFDKKNRDKLKVPVDLKEAEAWLELLSAADQWGGNSTAESVLTEIMLGDKANLSSRAAKILAELKFHHSAQYEKSPAADRALLEKNYAYLSREKLPSAETLQQLAKFKSADLQKLDRIVQSGSKLGKNHYEEANLPDENPQALSDLIKFGPDALSRLAEKAKQVETLWENYQKNPDSEELGKKATQDRDLLLRLLANPSRELYDLVLEPRAGQSPAPLQLKVPDDKKIADEDEDDRKKRQEEIKKRNIELAKSGYEFLKNKPGFREGAVGQAEIEKHLGEYYKAKTGQNLSELWKGKTLKGEDLANDPKYQDLLFRLAEDGLGVLQDENFRGSEIVDSKLNPTPEMKKIFDALQTGQRNLKVLRDPQVRQRLNSGDREKLRDYLHGRLQELDTNLAEWNDQVVAHQRNFTLAGGKKTAEEVGYLKQLQANADEEKKLIANVLFESQVAQHSDRKPGANVSPAHQVFYPKNSPLELPFAGSKSPLLDPVENCKEYLRPRLKLAVEDHVREAPYHELAELEHILNEALTPDSGTLRRTLEKLADAPANVSKVEKVANERQKELLNKQLKLNLCRTEIAPFREIIRRRIEGLEKPLPDLVRGIARRAMLPPLYRDAPESLELGRYKSIVDKIRTLPKEQLLDALAYLRHRADDKSSPILDKDDRATFRKAIEDVFLYPPYEMDARLKKIDEYQNSKDPRILTELNSSDKAFHQTPADELVRSWMESGKKSRDTALATSKKINDEVKRRVGSRVEGVFEKFSDPALKELRDDGQFMNQGAVQDATRVAQLYALVGAMGEGQRAELLAELATLEQVKGRHYLLFQAIKDVQNFSAEDLAKFTGAHAEFVSRMQNAVLTPSDAKEVQAQFEKQMEQFDRDRPNRKKWLEASILGRRSDRTVLEQTLDRFRQAAEAKNGQKIDLQLSRNPLQDAELADYLQSTFFWETIPLDDRIHIPLKTDFSQVKQVEQIEVMKAYRKNLLTEFGKAIQNDPTQFDYLFNAKEDGKDEKDSEVLFESHETGRPPNRQLSRNREQLARGLAQVIQGIDEELLQSLPEETRKKLVTNSQDIQDPGVYYRVLRAEALAGNRGLLSGDFKAELAKRDIAVSPIGKQIFQKNPALQNHLAKILHDPDITTDMARQLAMNPSLSGVLEQSLVMPKSAESLRKRTRELLDKAVAAKKIPPPPASIAGWEGALNSAKMAEGIGKDPAAEAQRRLEYRKWLLDGFAAQVDHGDGKLEPHEPVKFKDPILAERLGELIQLDGVMHSGETKEEQFRREYARQQALAQQKNPYLFALAKESKECEKAGALQKEALKFLSTLLATQLKSSLQPESRAAICQLADPFIHILLHSAKKIPHLAGTDASREKARKDLISLLANPSPDALHTFSLAYDRDYYNAFGSQSLQDFFTESIVADLVKGANRVGSTSNEKNLELSELSQGRLRILAELMTLQEVNPRLLESGISPEKQAPFKKIYETKFNGIEFSLRRQAATRFLESFKKDADGNIDKEIVDHAGWQAIWRKNVELGADYAEMRKARDAASGNEKEKFSEAIERAEWNQIGTNYYLARDLKTELPTYFRLSAKSKESALPAMLSQAKIDPYSELDPLPEKDTESERTVTLARLQTEKEQRLRLYGKEIHEKNAERIMLRGMIQTTESTLADLKESLKKARTNKQELDEASKKVAIEEMENNERQLNANKDTWKKRVERLEGEIAASNKKLSDNYSAYEKEFRELLTKSEKEREGLALAQSKKTDAQLSSVGLGFLANQAKDKLQRNKVKLATLSKKIDEKQKQLDGSTSSEQDVKELNNLREQEFDLKKENETFERNLDVYANFKAKGVAPEDEDFKALKMHLAEIQKLRGSAEQIARATLPPEMVKDGRQFNLHDPKQREAFLKLVKSDPGSAHLIDKWQKDFEEKAGIGKEESLDTLIHAVEKLNPRKLHEESAQCSKLIAKAQTYGFEYVNYAFQYEQVKFYRTVGDRIFPYSKADIQEVESTLHALTACMPNRRDPWNEFIQNHVLRKFDFAGHPAQFYLNDFMVASVQLDKDGKETVQFRPKEQAEKAMNNTILTILDEFKRLEEIKQGIKNIATSENPFMAPMDKFAKYWRRAFGDGVNLTPTEQQLMNARDIITKSLASQIKELAAQNGIDGKYPAQFPRGTDTAKDFKTKPSAEIVAELLSRQETAALEFDSFAKQIGMELRAAQDSTLTAVGIEVLGALASRGGKGAGGPKMAPGIRPSVAQAPSRLRNTIGAIREAARTGIIGARSGERMTALGVLANYGIDQWKGTADIDRQFSWIDTEKGLWKQIRLMGLAGPIGRALQGVKGGSGWGWEHFAGFGLSAAGGELVFGDPKKVLKETAIALVYGIPTAQLLGKALPNMVINNPQLYKYLTAGASLGANVGADGFSTFLEYQHAKATATEGVAPPDYWAMVEKQLHQTIGMNSIFLGQAMHAAKAEISRAVIAKVGKPKGLTFEQAVQILAPDHDGAIGRLYDPAYTSTEKGMSEKQKQVLGEALLGSLTHAEAQNLARNSDPEAKKLVAALSEHLHLPAEYLGDFLATRMDPKSRFGIDKFPLAESAKNLREQLGSYLVRRLEEKGPFRERQAILKALSTHIPQEVFDHVPAHELSKVQRKEILDKVTDGKKADKIDRMLEAGAGVGEKYTLADYAKMADVKDAPTIRRALLDGVGVEPLRRATDDDSYIKKAIYGLDVGEVGALIKRSRPPTTLDRFKGARPPAAAKEELESQAQANGVLQVLADKHTKGDLELYKREYKEKKYAPLAAEGATRFEDIDPGKGATQNKLRKYASEKDLDPVQSEGFIRYLASIKRLKSESNKNLSELVREFKDETERAVGRFQKGKLSASEFAEQYPWAISQIPLAKLQPKKNAEHADLVRSMAKNANLNADAILDGIKGMENWPEGTLSRVAVLVDIQQKNFANGVVDAANPNLFIKTRPWLYRWMPARSFDVKSSAHEMALEHLMTSAGIPINKRPGEKYSNVDNLKLEILNQTDKNRPLNQIVEEFAKKFHSRKH